MRVPWWSVWAGVLGLLAAPGALAASYYVNDATTAGDVNLPGCSSAPLGADVAGCGTCAAPCRNPNYVYASYPLGAGDVVHLNAGDYGPAPLQTSPFIDATSKFGVSGNPIVFRGTVGPGGQPLTRFNGQATAQAGVNIAVPWIHVENVSITNTGCPSGAPFGSGVYVDAANLSGIRIHNVEVFGTNCSFGAPIDFESTANPCVGCEISHCSLHDNGADTGAGLWIKYTGGLRVTRNVITRNAPAFASFPGIVMQGTPGALVDGNLVHANGGAALSLGRCAGCPPIDAMVVRNNTFWGNQLAPSGSAPGEVVLVQQVTNLTFENNIVGCAKNACIDADQNSTFLSSNYNDWVVSGTARLGTRGGSNSADLAAWRSGTGQDAQSLSVDPLFASATDFHLQSVAGRPGAGGARAFDAQTSPLVDRGSPGTPVGAEPAPNGGRVELGAYGGTVEAALTPVVLLAISGGGQVGPAGAQLPLPLVVEVSGLGTSIPEQGVTIAFAPAAGGTGAVAPATAITDAAGRASTRVSPVAGTQTFTATVVNVGGTVPALFTVVGLPGDGGEAGVPDGGVSTDGGAGADGGAPDGGVPDGGGGALPGPPASPAQCAVEWTHAFSLQPPDGWSWSLTAAPEGVAIDPATGALRWTPSPRQVGPNAITVRAERSTAALESTLGVEVACPGELSLRTGCACGATPGAALLWPGLIGLLLAAARRRAR